MTKKQFKPTYLYIKTHNITRLKYFGKTTTNRTRYRGSGTHWINHIKKHGYDVTTEILGYFIDETECIAFALEFSTNNNIVESKDWANQRPENGIDGGDTTSHKTEEEKLAIKEKQRQSFLQKTPDEIKILNKNIGASVKQYISENKDDHAGRAKDAVITRKLNGRPWHSELTKEHIKNNNKVGTKAVRSKISETLTGRKNPEHSERMSKKTGLNNKNTRLFILILPTFEEISIVGCKGLKTYCLHNNLPYDRMIKHLDKGKITTTSSMGPANVKNCINYEIREIKNVKF